MKKRKATLPAHLCAPARCVRRVKVMLDSVFFIPVPVPRAQASVIALHTCKASVAALVSRMGRKREKQRILNNDTAKGNPFRGGC